MNANVNVRTNFGHKQSSVSLFLLVSISQLIEIGQNDWMWEKLIHETCVYSPLVGIINDVYVNDAKINSKNYYHTFTGQIKCITRAPNSNTKIKIYFYVHDACVSLEFFSFSLHWWARLIFFSPLICTLAPMNHYRNADESVLHINLCDSVYVMMFVCDVHAVVTKEECCRR